MTNKTVEREYFSWLCDQITTREYRFAHYKSLLWKLNTMSFEYSIELDKNRESDGLNLRYRFGDENGYTEEDMDSYIDYNTASVLEVLIGLALRCEEHIMTNMEYGNRTSKWFWLMISNLGLSKMSEYCYSENKIERAVNIMMNRLYNSDGTNGGLFIIDNPPKDLRDTELWYQLNWFITKNNIK